MSQAGLFDDLPPAAPAGCRVVRDFLTRDEEARLIALLQAVPLEEARYKQYLAKRRVVSFGGHFDYDANRLRPSEALPQSLEPLRDRVAAWLGIAPQSFVHALAAEYRPGTTLGWHRDVPDFETVAGVCLLGSARMRFRRYPPADGRTEVHSLELPPRCAYVLADAARWDWQHSIAPTPGLRYSVTFRTARGRP